MTLFRLARMLLATAVVPLLLLNSALAEPALGIRLGDASVSTWRFGVTVKATNGVVTGILATTPVPKDWPEQQVKIVKEEKSRLVGGLNYRLINGGVKQLLVNIPRLMPGEEASAVVTMEITKRTILEPVDPAALKLPPNSAKVAKYLLPSPFIESSDSRIKSLVPEVMAGKVGAWERAAAAFDWVRANVRYEFAEEIRPAVAALKDGHGDCEELSSLVIALWRAGKIPGRAVWVPGHCYPEFCLADERGQLHWLPCQAAGADRQFGSMIEDRPILQKGDNFKVPEENGTQRYVKQFMRAKEAAAPPEVKFIMERVGAP